MTSRSKNTIKAVVAVCALSWASPLPAQTSPQAQMQYIGSATMSADGTITVYLDRTAGGGHAQGTFTYKTDDPDYEKTLKHIGGLKPGETKPVKPWPNG